jgi:hypothetical protein
MNRVLYDAMPDQFLSGYPRAPLRPEEMSAEPELEPKKDLKDAVGGAMWDIVDRNLVAAERNGLLREGVRIPLFEVMQRQNKDELTYPRSTFGNCLGFMPLTTEKLLLDSVRCADCMKERNRHLRSETRVPTNTIFCDTHTFAAMIVGAEFHATVYKKP